ncbi:MAG: hypothetical protein AAF541_20875 [Pseudomonadota bacterium]
MGFVSFVVLVLIAYLLWRISDQMPDILFRLSEIQRDISELRRKMDTDSNPPAAAAESSDTDDS